MLDCSQQCSAVQSSAVLPPPPALGPLPAGNLLYCICVHTATHPCPRAHTRFTLPAGNLGPHGGQDHLRIVANYIRNKYPFWNRTQGKDHIMEMTLDR